MSLTEELNSLKLNLSQTREKFITNWTTEHYDQLRNRQAKLYKNLCQKCKDNVTQLGEDIVNTRNRVCFNEEAMKKSTDEEHEQLESLAALYRNSLDTQIRKTSGGRMQFIFSSLDRSHPDYNCYFFTKLSEEDRTYIVSDCEPPVPDLDQLVYKLNQTNNLLSFVADMRKRFKQILSKE